jgi:hypothetical protein
VNDEEERRRDREEEEGDRSCALTRDWSHLRVVHSLWFLVGDGRKLLFSSKNETAVI